MDKKTGILLGAVAAMGEGMSDEDIAEHQERIDAVRKSNKKKRNKKKAKIAKASRRRNRE